MSWVDEYMKWNRTEYGGTTQLVVESDKVWTPNLVLVNNVNKLEKIGDSWHIVRFLPDGTALYFPADVLSASCSVDVTYYPWDRHKCHFLFTVWAYFPNEIQFRAEENKVQTSYFSENGAWTFIESNVNTPNADSALEFVLYLERKPRFVLVNVVIPIIFLAYLNAVILLIPGDSGERISCSITVLLALAVFLTLVGDNLPKTSSPLSFFSYYLLIVLVISICMTLATIFNIRLYYKDNSEPVPICLNSFVKYFRRERKNQRKQKYLKNDLEHNGNLKCDCTQNQLSLNTSLNNPVYSGHRALKSKSGLVFRENYQGDGTGSIKETICRIQQRDEEAVQQRDEEASQTASWKDVSVVFDKICFVVFVIALTISTVIFFVRISTGSQV